jgi:hypothetical protein
MNGSWPRLWSGWSAGAAARGVDIPLQTWAESQEWELATDSRNFRGSLHFAKFA